MTEKEVVVYCDESRHDPSPANLFMGIGSLWVPRELHADFKRSLGRAVADQGIGAEVKWSKVSAWSQRRYQALIDVFADFPAVRFRTVIVEHALVDNAAFHQGDAELGFYKFYYELLVKWLEPNTRYIILLDHKVNSEPGRYRKLEKVLQASVPDSTTVRRVTALPDSGQSRIVQLSDLLTGAVASSWCGIPDDSPKGALAAYVAGKIGARNLRFTSPSPRMSKFNIFRIRLTTPPRPV